MKLTDLAPRWFGWTHDGVGCYVGITFLCPHCRQTRLAVTFKQPIGVGGFDVCKMNWPDGGEHFLYGLQWDRAGDTFETLSISPSIDVSSAIDWKNHWHGSIQNGDIR